MINPVLVPLFRRLVDDPIFTQEIVNWISAFATDLLEDRRKGQDVPSWPGWQKALKSFDLFNLVEATFEHQPRLQDLYTDQVVTALQDEKVALADLVMKVVPEHEAKNLFNERVEEWLGADVPYYGRRYSMELREEVARLAHTQPELRKHLVPLLRQAAGRVSESDVRTFQGRRFW